MESKRSGRPSPDYWERVTEPEALLIKGDWQRSLELYHAARVAHHTRLAAFSPQRLNWNALLGVLDVPADIKQQLMAEFNLHL